MRSMPHDASYMLRERRSHDMRCYASFSLFFFHCHFSFIIFLPFDAMRAYVIDYAGVDRHGEAA